MQIEYKFNWCEKYQIDTIKIYIGEIGINILDSYKIRKVKHMKEVLNKLATNEDYKKIKLNKRWLQICEWKAHNLLFNLGYKQERTKHLDLNENNKWYINLGYVCLSLLYF